MTSYEDEGLKCRKIWEKYCRGDFPEKKETMNLDGPA